MENEAINQFNGQQFINIETYRKNGVGVRTPVWFYQDDSTLYFTTEATSYKVKRIRANHQVQVAPCKVNGEVLGEWVPAQAELLDTDRIQHVNQLFRKKYGFQKFMFDLVGKLRKREMTALAVHLAPEQAA
jgi:PPOX class probable F420-dependent enzyme